jgi:hypothetical protein
MIEPVELKDFFAAFFSGAMVVLSGALYALLFAWSRIHGPARMMVLAYAAYALLVVSVVVLSDALHLGGFWWIVAATMLIGYLLAPHGIWHLCAGTHADADPGGVGPAD